MIPMKRISAGAAAFLLAMGFVPAFAQDADGARNLGGAATSDGAEARRPGDPIPGIDITTDQGGGAARRPGDPIPNIDITTDQGGGRAIDDDSDGDSIPVEDDGGNRTN